MGKGALHPSAVLSVGTKNSQLQVLIETPKGQSDEHGDPSVGRDPSLWRPYRLWEPQF